MPERDTRPYVKRCEACLGSGKMVSYSAVPKPQLVTCLACKGTGRRV